MSVAFGNSSKSGLDGANVNEEVLLVGASGGTIVKSLEIIVEGNASCNAVIIRKDANDNAYATINLQMKANDYLLLWEGFFVIPAGHKLCFGANSNYCKAVANYVDITVT